MLLRCSFMLLHCLDVLLRCSFMLLCCYAVMLLCCYAVMLFRCAAPRAVLAGRERLGTKANCISRFSLSFFIFHGTYGNQTENNVNMFLIVNQ